MKLEISRDENIPTSSGFFIELNIILTLAYCPDDIKSVIVKVLRASIVKEQDGDKFDEHTIDDPTSILKSSEGKINCRMFDDYSCLVVSITKV